VSQWKTTGVPVEHCPRIERLTAGAVRCEEMRPEVDWGYLRATDCGVKVGAGDTASIEQKAA
jgi:DNA-binding transcriptional regulator YdaS (Cro superfamily)